MRHVTSGHAAIGEIEGLLALPGGVPATALPLVVLVHGGPTSCWSWEFAPYRGMANLLAASGYAVLLPNPRGSAGRGQEFARANLGDMGGGDLRDILAGVDALVEAGTADDARVGIMGGSYGGFMSCWAITQTDRFAAAVSQRSISDWAGWWYTADFTLFTPRWFRGAPFEQAADFAQRSAITHVAKVKTPLMLIEGEVDWRTPAAEGGEQMFRALKYLKKPTVMVRFPDESHDLSRTGKPWHRVERLRHLVGWFDKYLQGKTVSTYDQSPSR